jgi:hypothetical protein
MSQAVLGGLVGIIGSAFVIRRVKEIKMYYADSGEHDVLLAVCVSGPCIVDHVDVDGATYRDLSLHSNDLIIGGKVTIKSGRMFIMRAEVAGVLSL